MSIDQNWSNLRCVSFIGKDPLETVWVSQQRMSLRECGIPVILGRSRQRLASLLLRHFRRSGREYPISVQPYLCDRSRSKGDGYSVATHTNHSHLKFIRDPIDFICYEYPFCEQRLWKSIFMNKESGFILQVINSIDNSFPEIFRLKYA